jgi:hypothetical protein
MPESRYGRKHRPPGGMVNVRPASRTDRRLNLGSRFGLAREHGEARAERLRLHEVQVHVRAVAKQAGAAPSDDWIDPEAELIDQVVLQQGARELAAAVHDDRLSRLPLQPGNLRRDIAGEQGGVPFQRFVQGRRRDVLGEAVDPVDKPRFAWSVVGRCPGRPGSGEDLVGLPPHEQCVRREEKVTGVRAAFFECGLARYLARPVQGLYDPVEGHMSIRSVFSLVCTPIAVTCQPGVQ